MRRANWTKKSSSSTQKGRVFRIGKQNHEAETGTQVASHSRKKSGFDVSRDVNMPV